MGQIWAAIKSLGVVAELIREVLKWVREYQRKRDLDTADEHHEKNAADIDAAFSGGNAGGLSSSPAAQPSAGTPATPPVSSSPSGGPGVGAKGP